VLPSIAERREQAFSLGGGPLFEHHTWTIPGARVPGLSDRCSQPTAWACEPRVRCPG
jgi:hypothetical protein